MSKKAKVKKADVTTRQADQVRKMANDKGIGRGKFQVALDDGTMARFLDAIKSGYSINVFWPLVPPLGGRIHTLCVAVDPKLSWREAIRAGAPNTADGFNVCGVGSQYPVASSEIEEIGLVLVNFGSGGGSWPRALAWAKQFGLHRTHPRQVFAVGEQHPNLLQTLGDPFLDVVETEGCTFAYEPNACFVKWDNIGRWAMLGPTNHPSVDAWFAFRR